MKVLATYESSAPIEHYTQWLFERNVSASNSGVKQFAKLNERSKRESLGIGTRNSP